MPPSTPLRICAFRPRARVVLPTLNRVRAARSYADNKHNSMPRAEDGRGPNMHQQEHVSEEAAKTAKIQGKDGPDMDQGRSVQDIMEEEGTKQHQAPEVLKEQVNKGAATAKPSTSTGGTRSFSTFTRRRLDMHTWSSASSLDPSMLPSASQLASYTSSSTPISPSTQAVAKNPGHKFPLPNLPLESTLRQDHRQDPIILQLTNLLMKDGKKATAQRNMSTILTILRTSPAPTYAPTRPLLPGAPPASHLPLNPVLYLTLAVDSVAPLLRLRVQRGAAGGGMALQIPVPLAVRQRRRQAFMWILDAASKRQNRGSGRDTFAQRVAQEIIAVVEGRSAVWERRNAVHRLGTVARTNLNFGRGPGRRF